MTGAQDVRILAPAKVNLFLELHRKRPDGYHELETLMASVELFDEIELEPAEELTLEAKWAAGLVAGGESTYGPVFGPLPPQEKNLAFRALELLRLRYGVSQGARATLTKRIPAEAGLGGASSDAAAALVAGNRLWKLGLRTEQLQELAAELGSDVPFFLTGGWALCRGRGEIISAVEGIPPIWVVIVRPPYGLSTPRVYSKCQVPETPIESRSFIEALRRGDETALAGQFVNRLWLPALELEPRLALLAGAFSEVGLAAHQMSGSGSSYFGVTFDRGRAIRAAAILRGRSLGFVALCKGGTKNACIASADTLSS